MNIKFFENNPKINDRCDYLYNLGYTDKDIALQLNRESNIELLASNIRTWRKINNLPSTRTFGDSPYEINNIISDKIIILISKGLSDMEISKKLHIKPSKITKWRRKNKIKSNYKYLSPIEEEKRMMLYKKGFSDYKIAKTLNLGAATITAWRKRRNLSPNYKRQRPKK